MQQVGDRSSEVRATARTVDAEVADFLKAANAEMVGSAGVRYLDAMRSLHGDLDHVRVAVDAGATAKDFVDRVISDFGLARVGEQISSAQAADFNRAKIALVEFSGAEDGWKLSSTGTVYRQEEDGVARIAPVLDRNSGSYGFGIEFAEGATMGVDGVLKDAGERVPAAAAFDIGETVAAYETTRENKAQVRFG